jgi:hypothetical protein
MEVAAMVTAMKTADRRILCLPMSESFPVLAVVQFLRGLFAEVHARQTCDALEASPMKPDRGAIDAVHAGDCAAARTPSDAFPRDLCGDHTAGTTPGYAL